MDIDHDWSAEIRTLIEQVKRCYLVPKVAEQVSRSLQRRLVAGAYRHLTDEQALAAAVTADMQSISGDDQLLMVCTHDVIPERNPPDAGASPEAERATLTGHGFARVERLPGNVGLVDIRRFYDPSVAGAGEAAVAAMNLVAGADVLLVDLRGNNGGDPDMIALICSYLFDHRTQLSSLHFPAEGATLQYWTTPFVTGARFGGDNPIYALTSGRTLSGGEAMAYDLQQCGRAVVVGEVTAGASTVHYPCRVSAHLMAAVPSGYSVNPGSGTNWEGGVKPDVAVPAEQAFDAAYRLALEHVLDLGRRGVRAELAEQAMEMLAEVDARLASERVEQPA